MFKYKNIKYIDRVSDIPDHILFVAIFAIGAFAIIALKHIGVPQVIVTFTPVTLMIFYAVFIGMSDRFKLREDKAGDNLYYLGFLYTLVSLSYSLYALQLKQEGMQIIISNFGIALSTTIVGLIFRVIFGQLREDPVEIEQQVRLELSESAQNLKSEMNVVILEFNDFRRQLIQSLTEGMTDITDKTNSVSEENIKKYTEASERVLSIIDESFTVFTKNSHKLNKVSDKTVNTFDELIQRIENVFVPLDAISRKFDTLLEDLASNIEIISSNVLKQDDDVKVLSQTLESLANSTTIINENASTIAGELESNLKMLNGEIDSMKNNIIVMNENFTNLSGTLKDNLSTSSINVDQLKQQISDDFTAIESYKVGIQKNLQESDKMIGKVQHSLVSLTDTIIHELSDKDSE